MISYNLLNNKEYIRIMAIHDNKLREYELEKHIKEQKRKSIYNPNIVMAFGFGVESQSKEKLDDAQRISPIINKINYIKVTGKKLRKSTQDIVTELNKILTPDILDKIYSNKNIKYEIMVSRYTIGNMLIGNKLIRISYDFDNVALIGMHVIKELETRIFQSDDMLYLIAIRKDEKDKGLINRLYSNYISDEDEPIDLSEQTIMSNYIHDLIK